jgi:hypothetical protein
MAASIQVGVETAVVVDDESVDLPPSALKNELPRGAVWNLLDARHPLIYDVSCHVPSLVIRRSRGAYYTRSGPKKETARRTRLD